MTRILKFRVWDEKYKVWDAPGTIMVYPESMIRQGRIFSQFTGLLDKNTKEIFEGDIVSYTEKMHEQGDVQSLKAEVMWCKDFGAWALGKNNDWWNLFSDYGISKVEIVGNVFENEELLK
jgi:uncharacterized phage protein (TIGR01671 family)